MKLTEEQIKNCKEASVKILTTMFDEQKAYYKNNSYDLNRRFEFDLKIMALTLAVESINAIEAQQQEIQQLQIKLAKAGMALTIISDCYSQDLNMATYKTVKEALEAIEKAGGENE